MFERVISAHLFSFPKGALHKELKNQSTYLKRINLNE